ncbi:MAG TPA: hypothetical protein VI409_13495 [Gaiellaceae bacterium]|nr:hypothetical protein [Gaiellaceae bacterium]
MNKAMWDKIAAAGGIIGVVLIVIGILIIGQPPDIDADATTVADFFKDNRDQVLWGTFIQGLGFLSIIWFIGALGAAMRDAGEGRLAAVLGLAFAITFSIGAVAALARGALAFSIAEAADPGISLSFYRMGGYLDTTSNLLGAAIFLSLGGAVVRTGFVAKWWGWLSGLAGLWAILSSTAWARDGFWSPDGAGFVTFVVFLAWALVTSILLTMKMRQSTSAA